MMKQLANLRLVSGADNLNQINYWRVEKYMRKLFHTSKIRVAASLFLIATMFTATITAAPTENLSDGKTSVTLSADFFAALGALGLSAGTVGAGTLRGGAASFPITGGSIDLANAKAEINHTGGLSLSKGTTRVELTSFNIDTLGSGPVLTGLVTVNGDLLGRVPLFTLELPQLTLPLQLQAFKTLIIPNVKVKLSPEAAGALNSVFGVTAFTDGFNIGTAYVFGLASPQRRRLFLPGLGFREVDVSENGNDR
jgi:hypothetical protein